MLNMLNIANVLKYGSFAVFLAAARMLHMVGQTSLAILVVTATVLIFGYTVFLEAEE